MEKTIREIRESFRERYNKYIEEMNRLALETDEILSFMETTKKIKEELNNA